MEGRDYYPLMCGRLQETLKTLLDRTKSYRPKEITKRQDLDRARSMATGLINEIERKSKTLGSGHGQDY